MRSWWKSSFAVLYSFILLPIISHSPLSHSPPFRDGRVMGVVELSRSIGDGRFKHCGVISTPDVVRCSLTENDL